MSKAQCTVCSIITKNYVLLSVHNFLEGYSNEIYPVCEKCLSKARKERNKYSSYKEVQK